MKQTSKINDIPCEIIEQRTNGTKSITLVQYTPPQKIRSLGGQMLLAQWGIVHCVDGQIVSGYSTTDKPDFEEAAKRAGYNH